MDEENGETERGSVFENLKRNEFRNRSLTKLSHQCRTTLNCHLKIHLDHEFQNKLSLNLDNEVIKQEIDKDNNLASKYEMAALLLD